MERSLGSATRASASVAAGAAGGRRGKELTERSLRVASTKTCAPAVPSPGVMVSRGTRVASDRALELAKGGTFRFGGLSICKQERFGR